MFPTLLMPGNLVRSPTAGSRVASWRSIGCPVEREAADVGTARGDRYQAVPAVAAVTL